MITAIILLFAIVFFAIMWHYRVENDRLKDEIKERKREYDVLNIYDTKVNNENLDLLCDNADLKEEILHLKRSRNGLKGRYKQLLEAEKRKTAIANKTVRELMKKVEGIDDELEYEVGSIVEISGIKVEVQKYDYYLNGCDMCYFHKHKKCREIICSTDSKNVIFKKV